MKPDNNFQNGSHDEELTSSGPDTDLLEFSRVFLPQPSIDGALYLVDKWHNLSQSAEFREKAEEKYSVMDDLLKGAIDRELSPEAVNDVICRLIPAQFEDFPVWRQKTIRISGRDISASELFNDPFTCILAWAGIVGLHEGDIVPGYLQNPGQKYLYETMFGAMENFGHLFNSPEWQRLIVAEIARQYDLESAAGEDLLNSVRPAREEVAQLVYLLKKFSDWMRREFNERYGCMQSSHSFYQRCTYLYHPGLSSIQVYSTTSGAVIPSERRGNKIQVKNPARKDYFTKGLMGPGAEKISIIYQWDDKKTANTLASEQRRAEEIGQGEQHKQDSINNLVQFLRKPNIELSEGSFSGIWEYKNFFTLVSNDNVVFSGRDKDLKKINHGLELNHRSQRSMSDWVKHIIASNELSSAQRAILEEGLPNANEIHEKAMLLYKVQKKNVIKKCGEVIYNPEERAREIIEMLLEKGNKLL